MPRLFIVATPIGNLSDISARALQTLRDCDLIAAEDTRVTRALLNHFEIDTPCVSNHQHNEENRAAPIVARMLEEDLDVALVTDASIDRKSVVWGKSVDLGGRRIIKKKKRLLVH